MTRWQRDVVVEARADAILADARTAEEYAVHFAAQLRRTGFRAWRYRALRAALALLRGLRGLDLTAPPQ